MGTREPFPDRPPEGEAPPQDPPPEGPESELDVSQLKALKALLAGQTQKQAAKEAGVHRSTINRWVNENPHFQAALNRGRRQLRREASEQLRHALRAAASAVRLAASEGDAELSLRLLKEMGILEAGHLEAGPTDPEEIAKRQKRREAKDRKGRRWRRLMEEMDRESGQLWQALSLYAQAGRERDQERLDELELRVRGLKMTPSDDAFAPVPYRSRYATGIVRLTRDDENSAGEDG